MTSTNNSQTKGPSPIGAAIAGAAVGAAAVILSSKKNRDDIKEKLSQFAAQGEEKFQTMQEKVEDAKESSKKKLANKLGEAKDRLEK